MHKRFLVFEVQGQDVRLVQETSYAEVVRLFDMMDYDEKVEFLAHAYEQRLKKHQLS